MRSYPEATVQRLARSFGTDIQTVKHLVTFLCKDVKRANFTVKIGQPIKRVNKIMSKQQGHLGIKQWTLNWCTYPMIKDIIVPF